MLSEDLPEEMRDKTVDQLQLKPTFKNLAV